MLMGTGHSSTTSKAKQTTPIGPELKGNPRMLICLRQSGKLKVLNGALGTLRSNDATATRTSLKSEFAFFQSS